MTQAIEQHPSILCFRAFDMRDHFPEPIETFRRALELIQSEKAYLPEESANIICYLKSGQSIPIPDSFYLKQVPRFTSEEEAKAWILERDNDIESGSGWRGLGAVLADSNLPINEQVKQALDYSDTEVIDSQHNDSACNEVHHWLNAAINAMPNHEPELVTFHADTETCLYQSDSISSDFESHAMLSLKKPEHFVIEKLTAESEKLVVSIPDTAMDDVAIAWCKHRKLQSALGGPVGKEWGAPDCDYD